MRVLFGDGFILILLPTLILEALRCLAILIVIVIVLKPNHDAQSVPTEAKGNSMQPPTT